MTVLAAVVASATLNAGAKPNTAKSPANLKKAAWQVDKHVAQIFKSKRLKVPEVVDDGTFLRRTFLVGAGRIPTLKEAQNFLEIKDENKREILVSYLLGTDGYRSSMQNYIFDLLRVVENRRNQGTVTARPYVQFIYEAVRDNMPWDKFVQKLISARGNVWDPGNGPVGFYTRDKGMPLDNLSIALQVFTGERFECAQCHDSPVNEWERMDFYEMAAFTSGQQEINQRMYRRVINHLKDPDWRRNRYGNLLVWLRDNVHYHTISSGGQGKVALPSDYQYRDGDPGEMVKGKTKFGRKFSSRKSDAGTSRERFADWMTVENEHFDYVTINRMWERIMGSPITAPVDEYRKASETISPALTSYLMGLLKTLDYDLKAFQTVLMLTKTFQFAANANAFDAGVPQAFNGRQLERMSAEQVWDSFVTLVSGDPDRTAKRQFGDVIHYRGKPRMVGQKTMSQLGQEVVAIKDPAKYVAYMDELLDGFSGKYSSGKAKNEPSEMSMSMSMEGRGGLPGPAKGLARASELKSPAPAGHLLREFGQSSRKLINEATTEANIAQVLQVMNGHVEDLVVSNEKASVFNALEIGATDADKVRYIYYAILSRPPSEQEMNMLMRDVIDGSRESYQNLVSSLISTHEFIFVQ